MIFRNRTTAAATILAAAFLPSLAGCGSEAEESGADSVAAVATVTDLIEKGQFRFATKSGVILIRGYEGFEVLPKSEEEGRTSEVLLNRELGISILPVSSGDMTLPEAQAAFHRGTGISLAGDTGSFELLETGTKFSSFNAECTLEQVLLTDLTLNPDKTVLFYLDHESKTHLMSALIIPVPNSHGLEHNRREYTYFNILVNIPMDNPRKISITEARRMTEQIFKGIAVVPEPEKIEVATLDHTVQEGREESLLEPVAPPLPALK